MAKTHEANVKVQRTPVPEDVRRGSNIFEPEVAVCLFPGCDSPPVAPPEGGGPLPRYCERDDHNVISAHTERVRLEAEAGVGS